MCKPKILASSDWHGYLPPIPPCDIFIFAGDLEMTTNDDVERKGYSAFARHLEASEAQNIVVVGGNHDRLLQREPQGILATLFRIIGSRLIYLQDTTQVVNGVKIHGSPWTPPFFDWAFMAPEDELENRYLYVDADVDILVTHGPAHGTLDKNRGGHKCGSFALRNLVERIKPKAHVFGHIHEDGGKKADRFNGVSYNVAHVDHRYWPMNSPMEIEL